MELQSIPLPSALQRIDFDFPFSLMVKRDDLIHPQVSGNKYRKLQGILDHVQSNNIKGVLTFGGAFSNHIYATAAAAAAYGLESIGIIRGEDDDANPTLRFVRANGMKLFFVPRSEYSLKLDSILVRSIINQYRHLQVIPEGGDDPLAYDGLGMVITEMIDQGHNPDYLVVAAGTGTTAVGLLKALKKYQLDTKLLIFPALKHQGLHKDIIKKAGVDSSQAIYCDQYHFGGYARATEELIEFMNNFLKVTGIPLDPVYNAKLVYGLYQMGKEKWFKPADRVIWLHTGGIQGSVAYNYLALKKNRIAPLMIDL
ncbi:MAG: pyridoxal-phosphate dependent enzyme [Saprospiraceae bacterium]|jgi:1-aminocyclopropane-1-carboxylate deaminase|nr:pyridoxal-phosphate dependent enzyme [Saprospiraceae bacterium]MBK9931398.1 pyridoxal-phosphate dependent enzyme [Saprospiraceae bacterium]MBL0111214.1 pyridoxal-phosphate dependent enzyme [Saprospiraceae bacterium]MBP7921879.1 pyridoxal-phosphate dependent enzyme [Saprospiraceae bacterium]MBP8096708.1 pyridoxal-phosphate dependent enzyme [Saprospiraceae bacterium]